MMTPAQQLKNPETTLSMLKEHLGREKFGTARWWKYCVSHQFFLLRLELDEVTGDDDAIALALLGCDYLSGSTRWKTPNLHVELQLAEHDMGIHTWRLTDAVANFEAIGAMFIWNAWNNDFPGWFRTRNELGEDGSLGVEP